MICLKIRCLYPYSKQWLYHRLHKHRLSTAMLIFVTTQLWRHLVLKYNQTHSDSASFMPYLLLLCYISLPQMMPYLHLIICFTKDWIYMESAEINPVHQSIMRISNLPSLYRSLSLPKQVVSGCIHCHTQSSLYTCRQISIGV